METLKEYAAQRQSCSTRDAGKPCPDCDHLEAIYDDLGGFMPSESDVKDFYDDIRRRKNESTINMPRPFVEALEAAKRHMIAAMMVTRYVSTDLSGTVNDEAMVEFIDRMITFSMRQVGVPAIVARLDAEVLLPKPQGHA